MRLSDAILGLLLVAASAGAAEDLGRWDNLQSLRPGQRIQVVQTDLKSYAGDFLSVSADGIRFRVKNDERMVGRADVFRVGLRSGARRGRNALIGAAVGAGVGVAAGAGALAATNGSDSAGAIVATTTAIGAGAGGALSAIPAGYSTLYRASKAVQTKKR
jgi:hypothetical protein